MKFRDEKYKELIRKFIPGFDFEKERPRREINLIRDIISKKLDEATKEKGENSRFTSVKKKSLTPGVKAVIKGEESSPMIIKSVGRTGYIQFFGRKGSFNPIWVEPVE